MSATTVADQQWQPPVGDGNLLELSARLAGIVPEVQVSPSSSPASGQHQSVPVMEDLADIPLPPDTQGDVAEVPDVPFPPPPAGILPPGTSKELVQLLSLPPPPPPLLAPDDPSPATPSRTQQSEPSSSVAATMQQPLPSLWRQSRVAVSHQWRSSRVPRLRTQTVTPQQGPKQSLPKRRPPCLKDLDMVSQPLSSNSMGVPANRVTQRPLV